MGTSPHSMKLKHTLVTLLLAMLVALGDAFSKVPLQQEVTCANAFKGLDADMDGTVSLDELMATARKALKDEQYDQNALMHEFASMDVDDSGAIEYNDFKTAICGGQDVITFDTMEAGGNTEAVRPLESCRWGG